MRARKQQRGQRIAAYAHCKHHDPRQRLRHLSQERCADELDQIDPRLSHAAGLLQSLAQRAEDSFSPKSAPAPRVLAEA